MSKRPNFLLLMPETLRADAVFGPKDHRARTPNLDRLAEEGVSFSHCFAQNPICSPSRCSMFTGLYPHTHGHRSLLSLLKPEHRKWKYVYSPHDRNELYNLADDPHELSNLAGTAEHEKREAELRERLLKWMLDTGDVLPPTRDPRGWEAQAERQKS